MSTSLSVPGDPQPKIPWEDKPEGCREPIWRSVHNPIIPWNHLPDASSIFNSSVVPFGDGFAGVFRVDDRAYRHRLHVGRSEDGYHWKIDPQPIEFVCDAKDLPLSTGGYDPRITMLEGRYYITWCNGYHGPTVGMAWTEDFASFHLLENALPPQNRNGALFPCKINDCYLLLHRPFSPGLPVSGDIFISQSPDLCHWGKHRHVMSPQPGWDDTKVGAGPAPIETSEGWLLIYHGVKTTCNGLVYRMGAALLDLGEPWKVLHRSAYYLMGPRASYELTGDVPNVVFPCGLLTDPATGRLAIYYGAADTCIGLAFARVEEILAFIMTTGDKAAS